MLWQQLDSHRARRVSGIAGKVTLPPVINLLVVCARRRVFGVCHCYCEVQSVTNGASVHAAATERCHMATPPHVATRRWATPAGR